MPRRDSLQLLTFDEAAALLGVHRSTVARMVAAGDLKLFKWRRTSRVYRSELERFLKAHTTRAPHKQTGQSVVVPLPAPAPATAPVDRTSEPVALTHEPAAPVPEPAGGDSFAPPSPATAPPRSIVVLEDDENIRRFLVYALMAEGYAVRECASYDELVLACAEAAPDLIITDGWGSNTLTLEPAERDALVALARHYPTILTTGRLWAERADPADLNLAAILTKPFELDQLLTTMRSLES